MDEKLVIKEVYYLFTQGQLVHLVREGYFVQ